MSVSFRTFNGGIVTEKNRRETVHETFKVSVASAARPEPRPRHTPRNGPRNYCAACRGGHDRNGPPRRCSNDELRAVRWRVAAGQRRDHRGRILPRRQLHCPGHHLLLPEPARLLPGLRHAAANPGQQHQRRGLATPGHSVERPLRGYRQRRLRRHHQLRRTRGRLAARLRGGQHRHGHCALHRAGRQADHRAPGEMDRLGLPLDPPHDGRGQAGGASLLRQRGGLLLLRRLLHRRRPGAARGAAVPGRL